MGWIIIAIGAVFAAFGGAVAYSGLDYVQVERGWTAVISGTTMLSGGVIAMSVGVMTLKLKKIAGLLQNLSLPEEAVLKTFAPEPAPAEPPPPPPPPIPVDAAIKSGIGLAAEREAAAATMTAATAAAPAVGIGAHSVKPLEAPASLSPAPESEEPTEPESPTIAIYSQNASVSLDWLEDAIAGVNEPVEPSILARRPAEPEAAPRMERAPVEPETPPKAPPVHEPIVVGRYEASGTSYAMYSDGSVEAENEHGIFRFASMAELRAFIEEGQSLEEPQGST